MGIVISRYLDPASSEGALVRFIIDSLHLIRTLLTADAYFPELTPWNVIDFRGDDSPAFPLQRMTTTVHQAAHRERADFDQRWEECAVEPVRETSAVNYSGRLLPATVVAPDDQDLLYTTSPRIRVAELPVLCV